MVWAFIPILIVLVLIYAIVSYQVGYKVAAKSLQAVFACLAVAIGIFALAQLIPTEWEDYVWSG